MSTSLTNSSKKITDFRAYEATPGISVIVLPDSPRFTYVAVSNDFIGASGMKREDVIGKGHFEVFPKSPDDPNFTGEQNLNASFEYIIRHKISHEIPLQRYDIPDGDGGFTQKYWKINNAPILDDAGDVLYIIHSAIDITDQIVATQKVEAIEGIEKAYRLFMNAPVIIGILKGADYRIELANEGLLEVWGRTDDVIGKPLLEVIPELASQGFIALLDEVCKTGEPFYAYEHPIALNRYGKEEVFYFDFVYKPFYEDETNEKATGVISVGHDVTAQVLARQRVAEVTERLNFRNALFEAQNEATPDGVLIVDAKGKMLLHNKRFAEIWGMPQDILDNKDDEAALQYAQTVLTDPQGFIDRVASLYKNGKEKSYDQIRFKDGRIIERNGTPILAENGLYYGWAWYFRDITERISQEQKFRNVVEQAPDPILILKGEDMVLEVANEALLKLWNVDRSAIGKTFLEILPEMEGQGFLELLRQVYHSGDPFHGLEVPAIFKESNGDSKTVYFNFTYQPYREADGTITGVIAVAVDVTEQVKARKRTEESAEQFRTLANSIFQLAWMADATGWIHWYNDRWYEYTGTTLEEMQGWGWQKVHHPEHIDRVVNFVKEAWLRPEAFELTFPLRRKDGQYRWFLTRVYPVRNSEGKIVQWIGTNTDIDEQKQLEALLEDKVQERTQELENQKNLFDNILKNSSNGISLTEMIRDQQGHIIDAATILANDAAVKLTGLPRDIYLSTLATELDPEILKTPYGLTCLKTLETGEPSFIQYYLEVTGRWLELTISKMDADHLIHIFTDVTPIKEAQLQLERTVDELKRSNTNLEEFAYAASHDLKEPIRKILFFGDRLKSTLQDSLNEEETRSFNRMEMAAKRMSSLIDDLLAYSQVSLRPRTFDEVNLNQVINLVLEDLDLEIEDKSAKIKVEELFTIKGHHRQLQQAFQNLISNALKYSKPGVPPQIAVKGKIVQAKETGVKSELMGKEYYSITINDNGIGFEQKDVERIFNVFTRLHGNTEYRGTGVGLSIVRKVIENHNGFITAKSEPGEGAVFTIYLPVA